MAQSVTERRGLLESVPSTKPTKRVDKLREFYLASSARLFIDRELITVRSLRATEGEPMVTRRAKAFAEVVRKVPITITPDEPLVGWISGSPDAVDVIFEGTCDRMEKAIKESGDVKTAWGPFPISEEGRKAVREEIIPYWKGDGNWNRTRFFLKNVLTPPEVADVCNSATFGGIGRPGTFLTRAHVAHNAPNYEKVLKKGFIGIKRDVEERLARIDTSNPDELKKVSFLKGVVLAMEAAAEIGARFSRLAKEMAGREKDEARRSGLLRIAEICERVPAHPARTFHEALQSLWFAHILHWWETPGIGGIGVGRVDQYFYPYYEADIREGVLTREEAQELIDCFLMRFAQDLTPYTPTGGTSHHIDVGGYKPDGSDATNDLSFMFIEGMMHARMAEPNFGVLVHSKTPEALLIKASQLCALGTGHPMFLNQDEMVENFLSRGNLGGPPVTLELARLSGAIGCNEPVLVNVDGGFMVGASFSLTTPLELVFGNGKRRSDGKIIGVTTGDPRAFNSIEELHQAYQKQLAWIIKNFSVSINIAELILADAYPTPFQSALIEDCIENGISREAGGARYQFGPSIGAVGGPDVGDSFAAIKKIVFEDRKLTMSELCQALESNFQGREDWRKLLLRAPKYGNDEDYADSETAWVMHIFAEEVKKQRNSRGGYMLPSQIPLAGYVVAGSFCGALPSGRLAGEPLSDGISPTRGSDVSGPTSVLKSVGKVNNIEISDGQTLNMRFDPTIFEKPEGFKRLADFIRTLVDQKIHHVQLNVVSSTTLLEAQKEPDKYRDLMVRVAGYQTYFTKLPKSLQDGIIQRTEHGL